MNNDEIINLAEACGATVDCKTLVMYHHETIKFYRAAFNAGLEAAAKMTDRFAILNVEHDGVVHVLTHLTSAIRTLEMK